MNTAEILNEAANLIEKGFMQGSYSDTLELTDATRVCMLGAINKAQGKAVVDRHFDSEIYQSVVATMENEKFMTYSWMNNAASKICSFNNTHTQAQCASKLREAAEVWEKENVKEEMFA